MVDDRPDPSDRPRPSRHRYATQSPAQPRPARHVRHPAHGPGESCCLACVVGPIDAARDQMPFGRWVMIMAAVCGSGLLFGGVIWWVGYSAGAW